SLMVDFSALRAHRPAAAAAAQSAFAVRRPNINLILEKNHIVNAAASAMPSVLAQSGGRKATFFSVERYFKPLGFARAVPMTGFLRPRYLSRLAIEITIPAIHAATQETSTTSLRRKGMLGTPLRTGRAAPRGAMGHGRGVLARVGAAPERARCSTNG